MDLRSLSDLNEKRRSIRPLLSPTDLGDAVTSYYALWHDPRRTQITVHYSSGQRADGFVVVAQTGIDLFRPLVTLRAENAAVAGELLRAALVRGRSYFIAVPVSQASAVRTFLEIEEPALNPVYILNPARFKPIINVLVQRVDSPEGAPRFEIRSRGELMALSGTNWRSPDFAEVFVFTHADARGRGWGQAVVSACTGALLEENLRPLYIAGEGNHASAHVAGALGYVDSGLREFTGTGRLR